VFIAENSDEELFNDYVQQDSELCHGVQLQNTLTWTSFRFKVKSSVHIRWVF